MTTARAVVLGILQGLGEFLPISSSGHLIVVPWLMGWPDSGLAFDVALHLGTLAAVAFAFWRDWVRLIGAGLRGLAAGQALRRSRRAAPLVRGARHDPRRGGREAARRVGGDASSARRPSWR